MKRQYLFFGLIAFFCSSASADNCDVIKASAQIDDCTRVANKTAQRKLDESYGETLTRARLYYKDESAIEYGMALKKSQEIWVSMRDANCLLEAFEVEDGFPAHETLVNSCMSRMNLNRKAFLDSLPMK